MTLLNDVGELALVSVFMSSSSFISLFCNALFLVILLLPPINIAKSRNVIEPLSGFGALLLLVVVLFPFVELDALVLLC